MTQINESKQGLYALLILLLGSAACFPLLSLIVKGWVSGVLFFATLISGVLLLLPFFKHPPEGLRAQSAIFTADPIGRLSTFFVIAFVLPILSVALGHLLQGDWSMSRFDAPSRYLFALVVFMAIARYRSAVPRVLELAVPAATITTLFLIPYVPATYWSTIEGRLSNHFIDPLIFGQVALALGVMSLLLIRSSEKQPWYATLLQLIGGVVGIYLSLLSGSRTGWLAIPFIVFLWVVHYSPFSRWKTIILGIAITVVTMAVFYFGSSIVKNRVDAMHSEITNYQWSAVNPDTSVGHRINWIRIGWHFFSMRPLSGWGNESLVNNMHVDSIAMYASKVSRDELLAVGFHNDFVANAVRYGIGGLVATIAIFLIPFLFFAHCLRYKSVQSYAMIGAAYVLIQSVSSLSYHVLDFKFMASFYALMISLLMGVIVSKLKS
jgi:O-antigen ligase